MLVLHKVGELRQEWLQHAMETPPSPLRLCGSLAKGCCNGGGLDRGKKERAGMACTLEDEEMLQLRQGVMTPRSCFFSTKKVLSLTVVLVPTFSACKLLYFFVPSLARHWSACWRVLFEWGSWINIGENRLFLWKTAKSLRTGFISSLKTDRLDLKKKFKNENKKNRTINQKNWVINRKNRMIN
jgi:hypothetical protein